MTAEGGATTLEEGATLQLTATGTFSHGAPEAVAVTWSTSDPLLAIVSEAGLVTGVAEGEVTITATHAATGLTDTIVLNVTAPAGP